MTDERTLTGWGARPWQEVVAACDGLQAAWTDYSGFHVGRLPQHQPPATHIWAWSPDGSVLMRARLDGGTVIVGWLTKGAHAEIEGSATLSETVQVTERPMLRWAPEDKRVGLRGSVPQNLAWRQVDVETPDPVTFTWATIPNRTAASESAERQRAQ